MKSNLQGIELPTGGPRLGASISANEQKKSRKKVSKLKEPRQGKPYVKLHNLYKYILLFLLLSHFSFFVLFCFVLFFSRFIFALKEGAEVFCSYCVVKVGEFMKLSYACEDIVSTGFSRY